MDYLELQQRANVLVDKVNEYEANQAKYVIKEDDYLNEHKYVDLFTLRAVLNLLFGKTVTERADRTLSIPTSLRMFASTAPAWNSDFSITEKEAGGVELEYVLNNGVEFVGNPTMYKNGVVSNFSANDYIRVKAPVLNDGDSISYHIEFQCNSHSNNINYLLFDSGNNIYVIYDSGSGWKSYVSSSTVTLASDSGLFTGFSCWLNAYTTFGSSGSTSIGYSCYNSRGNSFQRSYTNTDGTPGGNEYIYLGNSNGRSTTEYFSNSSIDLVNSYYSINGEKFYFAIPNINKSTAELTQNYTVVGEPTIDENAVVSNFTTSNYLTYSQEFPTNTKIEKCFYFKDISHSDLCEIDASFGTEIYMKNNTLALWNGSSDVSISPTHPKNTVTQDRWWYIKLSYTTPSELTSQIISCDYEVRCLNDYSTVSSGTADIQFSSQSLNYIGNWGEQDHNRPFSIYDKSGYIDLFSSYYKIGDNDPVYFYSLKSPTGETNHDVNTIKHVLSSNIDVLNSTNMITLDSNVNTLNDRETRIKSGINYSYSSNIADALVTESQIANMFKWNTTTSDDIPNNTVSSNRQVPGIVCYYAGSDIDLNYTSTIPYNPTQTSINAVNYGTPSTYGGYYSKGSFNGGTYPYGAQYSQYSSNSLIAPSDKQALKLFMTGLNYTRGKLESPQQIWQPDEKYGDDNLNYGFNRQGQAVYHELVFKNRRSGSKDAGVDFVSGLDSVPDNDPQGLAMRIALAQQKDYFKNRHWWSELNDVYKADMTKFADNIIEASIEQEATDEHDTVYMTDTKFMNSYKLPYSLYADCFNQPL